MLKMSPAVLKAEFFAAMSFVKGRTVVNYICCRRGVVDACQSRKLVLFCCEELLGLKRILLEIEFGRLIFFRY